MQFVACYYSPLLISFPFRKNVRFDFEVGLPGLQHFSAARLPYAEQLEWMPLDVNYTSQMVHNNASVVARLQLVNVKGRHMKVRRPAPKSIYGELMRMDREGEDLEGLRLVERLSKLIAGEVAS